MEGFLFQASIYLAAAVVAVPVAKRLGLGSVLGYLTAGIIIGPMTGLVGSAYRDLQHFAEFGVVMMLFLVGLELEPRALWDMRHRLVGMGGLQIGLTAGAIMVGGMWLGLPLSVALAVGLVFSLSSTAIVLQTLNEKGLMQTGGGRSAFSVLLSQDIAVIPMLALIPLLALAGLDNSVSGAGDVAEASEATISLVAGLPGWGVTLVTIAAVAAVVLGGNYLIRPLFRYIHSAHLPELYTVVALLIVVGIASLMILVGLSPALGTFLAGVVLANSEFRHQLEADIEPFKGLLLGLFFITVGASINFTLLLGDFAKIIILTVAVMAVKATILLILAQVFHLRGRDRWLFTLGLAQAGEFGFVMLSLTVQQNVVPRELSETLLLVVALSMLLTPLLFIAYDMISKRFSDAVEGLEPDIIEAQGKTIIAGVGRFGQIPNRLLKGSGFETTVLDHDLDTVNLLRAFGAKVFFGDPTRPDLLRAAGLADAKVLIVALDQPESAVKLVKHARRERPDLHIVARAKDRGEVYKLFQAGANDIVRETFDASLRAGRYALEALGLSEFDAARQEQAFFRLDRHGIRELAELWDPDIPITKNAAFVARAKELNSEFELELTSLMESRSHDTASDDLEDQVKAQND
ncbi:MAG: cation:proton antiporter domain-containing protein [Paracoccaceae bacterium]